MRAVMRVYNRCWPMGYFVTFEGIEGCGKTTQIRLAADYLRQRRIRFITTEEPGGTPMGRKIRELLLNRSAVSISRESELLLFLAARAQHVSDVIIPALKDDCVVLCDRYADATVAYQGFGRGIDRGFLEKVNLFATSGCRPDMTVLFDLPVETGLDRALQRISGVKDSLPEDRFEHEEMEFHRRVRDGYLLLAKEEPGRFRVIDAARDIEQIHEQVRACFSVLTGQD